jgi:hypothetical protein
MDNDNTHPDLVTVEEYGTGRIVRGADGRFLPGTRSPAPITNENARDMHALRREQKQAAILEAANAAAILQAEAANDPQVKTIVGTDGQSWIRAVTLGRMGAAVDKDSPYGNAAATWLTENAGVSERQAHEQQYSDDPLRELGARVLEYLAARAQSIVMRTVDGQDDAE